jgi:hypothetical protein
METRTITIKSVERTSGTKKDGTGWHRISIRATDGKFYSSFKPIAEVACVPGTQLTIQVSPSQIANTYDINKVIEYVTVSADSSGHGQGGGQSPTTSDSRPAIEVADTYGRELLQRAVKMAHDTAPEWEQMSEYPYLIATLIQTMHGRITNMEIAAQDEKKYQMWGKKV